jgi:hypothetical protein
MGSVRALRRPSKIANFDLVKSREVWNVKHFNAILSQLREKNVVGKVERVSG